MATESSKTGTMVARAIKALDGHVLTGLSNAELAKALNTSPANVTRYLNTLIEEGLAVKLDNGCFALSIGMAQIAQKVANKLANAQAQINEVAQRISAGSY